MQPELQPVPHPEHGFPDALRTYLDAVNRHLVTTTPADLPDAALALAISEHLDAIGLDSIHNQETN